MQSMPRNLHIAPRPSFGPFQNGGRKWSGYKTSSNKYFELKNSWGARAPLNLELLASNVCSVNQIVGGTVLLLA